MATFAPARFPPNRQGDGQALMLGAGHNGTQWAPAAAIIVWLRQKGSATWPCVRHWLWLWSPTELWTCAQWRQNIRCRYVISSSKAGHGPISYHWAQFAPLWPPPPLPLPFPLQPLPLLHWPPARRLIRSDRTNLGPQIPRPARSGSGRRSEWSGRARSIECEIISLGGLAGQTSANLAGYPSREPPTRGQVRGQASCQRA